MNFKKFIIALGVVSLLTPSIAMAEAPVPRPGPFVINSATPAGDAIPKWAFGINANYAYASKNKVWVNGSSYNASNDVNFNIFVLKPRLGLGNGWDIRAAIPIIANDFDILHSKNGFGDVFLVLRKQLFSQDKGFPFSFAMGAGAVLPIGSSSYGGVGTGAWGLYGELGLTYAMSGGRQLIEFSLSYQWMGEGEAEVRPIGGNTMTIKDVDQNDAIKATGRYVYAINHYLDLGIETQFERIFQSSVNGVGRDDSYTSIYAGPAMLIKFPKIKANLGLSPQFALYNDYSAANKNGAGPAAESFRFEASFQKLF